MRLSKKKIGYLRNYCKRMLPKWRERYSGNIVGVHLGYKNSGETVSRSWAIVFHVQQKLGVPIKMIPAKINVTIAGEKVPVATDIIQTGVTRLTNVMMGDKAQSLTNLDEFGTAGLFLTVKGVSYVCSNMHVLGPEHVHLGKFRRPPEQQFQTDVICSNELDSTRAFLEKGEFGETDLAVARFQFPQKAVNKIKTLGQPSGFLEDNQLLEGMNVRMFGAKSGKVILGVIRELFVTRVVRYDSIEVTVSNLVATTLPVQSGDSGSVVLNDFLAVVGILVSMDDQFAYVIPWSSIRRFINNL